MESTFLVAQLISGNEESGKPESHSHSRLKSGEGETSQNYNYRTILLGSAGQGARRKRNFICSQHTVKKKSPDSTLLRVLVKTFSVIIKYY